uniref:TIR domain-containing adapter molecule 1 n=1 Tax=Malurus cyaneus samueli TaxID=2593467 RepID=A0A8C5U4R1_9PASS
RSWEKQTFTKRCFSHPCFSPQLRPAAAEMAQSSELQPSFEDVFNLLSQTPTEKLLSLKLKLKHLIPGPCSKLLQAMVLLTLGQETDARICLDALRDNQAAQYVQQIKLGTAGVQGEGEGLQPPQLDPGAVALLAQVYGVLAQEKLCSAEARDTACQAATKACHASKDIQQGTLNNIPAEDQGKQGSAASMGSGDGFGMMLRSNEDAGFPCPAGSNCVVRSSPVQIGGSSEFSCPRTLRSVGNSSLSSCLEISASPTLAFHTQPSVPECVPHPNGDRLSQDPQESSWVSTPSSAPGQDTASQVPQPQEALQVSPCHPRIPIPEMPLPSEHGQSSDMSSTVTEPPAPRENTGKKQDEKQNEQQFSAGVPDPSAVVDTAPAHVSIEDSYNPAGIPCNSAPASVSTCSLPPPSYSFSSTLPPLQESHSNLLYPPPLHSSPSPAWPPPSLPPMDPSEPDGAKFFTFVVLHATEDEMVAHEVRNLLENMGVSNGATLSEDFFIAGRSHMFCFQEAMENSAFMILLLTKNFPCNLCLFQTDTALMQSILDPSKQHSVIPFLPKANALERSQIPTMLSGLVILNESSPLFSRMVHKTFNPKRIKEKKALWDQMQRSKLQSWERYRAQQDLAALSLGCPPQVPPPWPPQPSPQHWCPPAPKDPAQRDPPPSQAQLPPGHYNIVPGSGGIPPLIIQHARMVQIGNHNTMRVGTAPAGPRDSEEQTRHNA